MEDTVSARRPQRCPPQGCCCQMTLSSGSLCPWCGCAISRHYGLTPGIMSYYTDLTDDGEEDREDIDERDVLISLIGKQSGLMLEYAAIQMKLNRNTFRDSVERSRVEAQAKNLEKDLETCENHLERLSGFWAFEVPEKDAELQEALKRFGHDSFRPGQLAPIKASLCGKDLVVIRPTGSGKSLIYQLPALLEPGLTVVIEPLKSLIDDQVADLQEMNLPARIYHGDNYSDDVLQEMLEDPAAIKLLYVTPEMLFKNRPLKAILRKLHSDKLLSRIVIDEAHCVAQWSHREGYKMIGSLRQEKEGYPDVPLIALTAVGTKETRNEIKDKLCMRPDCWTFLSDLNRPELFYSVVPKLQGKHRDNFEAIARFIGKNYLKKCGIIYCRKKQVCDDLADYLANAKGWKAATYHRDLDSNAAAGVYKKWKQGDIHIVVATVAFGMGIDHGPVRFVIHYNIPDSIETYYQESGRAGRDGKHAHCRLYYRFKDRFPNTKRDSNLSSEQEERKEKRGLDMLEYCITNNKCRKAMLLAHLEQPYTPSDCGNCDVCTLSRASRITMAPAATQALGILALVHALSNGSTVASKSVIWSVIQKGQMTTENATPVIDLENLQDLTETQYEYLLFMLMKNGMLRETRDSNACSYSLKSTSLALPSLLNVDMPVETQVEIKEEEEGDEEADTTPKKRKRKSSVSGKEYEVQGILKYCEETEQYLIKWVGYKVPTWEAADYIETDISDMVDAWWASQPDEEKPNSTPPPTKKARSHDDG